MRTNWFKPVILLCFVLVAACKSDPASMKEYLNGYWEISEVHRDGKLLKSYDFSSNIDYFEMLDDSTGFRKKVSPTLDGKYLITDHQTAFKLRVEDGKLVIQYSDRDVNYKETILEAESGNLRIRNEEGLIYTYKPYEPLDLTE